jgi:hypothetical protein
MRQLSAFALAVLVASGSASAAPGKEGSHPTLRGIGPLTLRGDGFRPGEIVGIAFTAPDFQRHRRIRTSAAGSFRIQIPPHGKCLGQLLVVAAGAAGDRARLTLTQRRCGPALPPAS